MALPDMGILAAIRKGEILRFSGSRGQNSTKKRGFALFRADGSRHARATSR
jgi:hypothetical protein